MKTNFSRIAALVLTLGVVATGMAAEETTPPKMVQVCEGCHGPKGVSQKETVPTIAGISEWVQEDNMQAYKDGARSCVMPGSDAMCAMMTRFTHEQIDEFGHYFAAQEFQPAPQEFDAELAAAGQALHEEHCGKCHTEGGSNPEDDASILAGQWMPYLRTQLAQFASGGREPPAGMGARIEGLTEADFEALVHYYASQQ